MTDDPRSSHSDVDPIVLGALSSRTWFVLIMIAAVGLVVMPVTQIYLNPLDWGGWIGRVRSTTDPMQGAWIRLVGALQVTVAFFACAGVVLLTFARRRAIIHRRLLQRGRFSRVRRSIHAVAPEQGPILLRQIAEGAGPRAGTIQVILDEDRASSSVVGDGKHTWLFLSLALTFGDAADGLRRFVLMHEAAHIRNGDHRYIGWVEATLVAALTVWLVFLFPFSFASLFDSHPSAFAIVGVFSEDAMALILAALLWLSYRAFLRARELDADYGAFAADPSLRSRVELALETAARESLPWWKRITRSHPTPHERLTLAADPARRLAPNTTLLLMVGVLSVIMSEWGSVTTVAKSQLVLHMLDTKGRVPLPGGFATTTALWCEAIFTYAPRLTVNLLAAGLLFLELSRSAVAQGWSTRRNARVAAFVGLGFLLGILLSAARSLIADLALSAATTTSELDLLRSIILDGIVWVGGLGLSVLLQMPFVLGTIGLALAMTFAAGRWSKAGRPWVRRSGFVLWAGFVPLGVGVLLWMSGVLRFGSDRWKDAIPIVCLPFLLAIAAVCLGLWHRGGGRRRETTGPGAFAQHEFSSETPTEKATGQIWRRASHRAIAGAVGGAFTCWMPIVGIILALPPDRILQAYGQIVQSVGGVGILTGGAIGFLRTMTAIGWLRYGWLLAMLGGCLVVEIVSPVLGAILTIPVVLLIAFSVVDRIIPEGSRLDRAGWRLLGVLVVAALCTWPLALASAAWAIHLGIMPRPSLQEMLNIGHAEPASYWQVLLLEAQRALGDTTCMTLPIALAVILVEQEEGRGVRDEATRVIAVDAVRS